MEEGGVWESTRGGSARVRPRTPETSDLLWWVCATGRLHSDHSHLVDAI